MLRRLAPLALGSALMLIPSPDAEACSPPAPGVFSSMPANGQSWPANAALLFEGHSVYADGFSATVGGAPAQVTLVDGLRGQTDGQAGGFGTVQVGVTLDPAPAPGQAVEVRWSECSSCEGYTLRYTAGAEEAPPPPPTPGLRFDLAYYDDILINGATCFYYEDLAYAWHLDLEGIGPGGYPVALKVTPRSLDGAPTLTEQTLIDGGEGVETVYYGTQASVVGDPVAESVCFDVQAQDLFGQYSDIASSCLPCNIATPELPPATGDQGYPNFPAEPDWSTQGAPYCGGLCDTGPECEEEGEGDGGVGCDSAPSSSSSLLSLAFLGALGLGLRRRSSL